MYDFMIALVSVTVVLGIMILVHEFGHFAAAKLLGVRVEVFSIGFGKRLVGFHRGETDYRISILPFLGGYVKMSGENPMDTRTGDQREFMSHPRWHRFLIAAAGPFMNILLAVALLTVVYMVHYERPHYLGEPANVGFVAANTPAEKAGIQVGDRIERIDGIQNPTWEQVIAREWLSPNQPLSITIQRAGQTFSRTVTPLPQGRDQIGSAGWLPQDPVQVAQLEPNMPAIKAGIRPGDEVVAIDGEPIRSIEALHAFFERNKDKPIDLTIARDGKELHIKTAAVMAKDENGKDFYRLGFSASRHQRVETLPFAAAFRESLSTNRENSKLILLLVEKMIQRKVSMKQLYGPIGIAQASGAAARQPGWTPLMQLMAIISLNLGIFNLFPIPIMDGGVILLLAIESIMRRDISMRIKERIYQAAFVFLIMFAVVVIYNDLSRAIPGLTSKLP